jgi:predicted ATPase/class 3 adenylate cyclase
MVASPPTGTVTFLFSDIEGSTRLLMTLGSGYPAVLARHHRVFRDQIAATGGFEVSTEGDAFFVAFSSAPAALECAAGVQRRLAKGSWPAGLGLNVRIGLHTGEGVWAETGYVGLDVHRAARIAAAAHGGQILLSDSTRALTRDAFPDGLSLKDLGEHRLKDLPAAVRLYQLLVDGLRAEFPPLRSIGNSNLPEALTSFVGREAEIEHVSALLHRWRLVTLTGPGGAGKTRLSIEVARRVVSRFPDGQWFVALDAVTDPDLVLPAIGRTLGVREDPSRPVSESLADSLTRRDVLLILDNLEQVIGAAPMISGLLAATAGPRVLCSSREVLRISGEQEYAVPPLALDPAVELFVERARQVRPDFDPSPDDLAAVAEICRRLDGLPLAIELAAARVRLFPIRALLNRLSDRLGALQAGARDLPQRQRTLKAAIEWSHDLLDPTEREIFARLAVFSGGADLPAVEAVVDPDGDVTADVVAVMTLLIEKSLVRAEEGPTGEPRFRMLETIRDYAAERLGAAPARAAVHERHLRYFVEMAERLERELFVQDPGNAFSRLEAENDNIRAAIEWSLSSGQPALGLRICAEAWRFWQQRGHLVEARPLLERLLLAPDPTADRAARARGLTAYGGIAYWQGDHAAARAAYEEALNLQQTTDDDQGIALAEYNLGWMLAFARETSAAARLLEQSAARYERLGDERGRLIVGEGLALNAMIAGKLAQAREIAESVAADARRLGMRFHYADTLGLLSAIYLEMGEVAQARGTLTERANVSREIGDVSSTASTLQFGAGLALAEERLIDAARLLGALQGLRDHGERFFVPSEVIPFTDPEARVRDGLSQQAFDDAWEEGRRSPPATALRYALGTVPRGSGIKEG